MGGGGLARGALTWDFMGFLQNEKTVATTVTNVKPYLTHQKYSEYSSTFTRGY